MPRYRLLLLSALSGWLGCQGDSDDSEPSCEGLEPSLSLGTGEFHFEAIDDGDAVTLVNGPQGGWHVWTSGLLTGLGPVVSVLATLVDEQSAIPIAGSDDLPVTLDLSEPGTGTFAPDTCAASFFGLFAYIDDAQPMGEDSYLDLICMLEGRPLSFSAKVTDEASGAVVTDSVRVRARLDPKNVPYCRQN